jgi:hypothetical protein
VYGNLGNQRVIYQGTGCGFVVCVNARTGEPVWRFRLSGAGVNADVILQGPGRLIAVHGKENIDSTSHGRMVSLKIPTEWKVCCEKFKQQSKRRRLSSNTRITFAKMSPN